MTNQSSNLMTIISNAYSIDANGIEIPEYEEMSQEQLNEFATFLYDNLQGQFVGLDNLSEKVITINKLSHTTGTYGIVTGNVCFQFSRKSTANKWAVSPFLM